MLKGLIDEIDVNTTVEIDMGAGKAPLKIKFITTWKKLSLSESKEVGDRLVESAMQEPDVIREYLRGWRNLKGEGEVEVEFNDENLELALESVPYAEGLMAAFYAGQKRRVSVNRKN